MTSIELEAQKVQIEQKIDEVGEQLFESSELSHEAYIKLVDRKNALEKEYEACEERIKLNKTWHQKQYKK